MGAIEEFRTNERRLGYTAHDPEARLGCGAEKDKAYCEKYFPGQAYTPYDEFGQRLYYMKGGP